MAVRPNSFARFFNHTRGTGATRISPTTGFIVGVDFSATSNTIGTGSKTFTLTADANVNREWTVGENVLVTAQAGATGTMTGVVTSYTASTQALVINVPAGGTTGSGTSTDWRIGSLEVRRDANGLVVETAATNLNTNTFTAPTTTASRIVTPNFTASPDGSVNAYKVAGATNTTPRNNGFGIGVSGTSLGFGGVITFFAKAEGANFVLLTSGQNDGVSINILTGNIVATNPSFSPINFTATLAANGFIRVSVAARAIGGAQILVAATTVPITNIDATDTGTDGVRGVVFYGVGTGAGTFIPTRGVSWTRNADTITFNSTALQNVRQGQGVIYVDADFPSSTTRAAALSLTGTNSEISLARQSSGTTSAFSKVAAVGNVDILALSAQPNNYVRFNGKTYTPMATGTAQDMNAVAYDGSTQVLIAGNGGRFSLSSDAGATWTNFTTADITNLNGAAYGAGTFVVVGNAIGGSGYIATIGSDGTVTRRVSNTTASFTSCRFLSGTFYAVSNTASTGRYSSDGVTWLTMNLPNISSFDVAFGNNFYVVIGQGNGGVNFAHSTDGINYTGVTLAGAVNFGTNNPSIGFGNGIFVAVGRNGLIYTATNPTAAANWTLIPSGTTQDLTSVLFSTRDNCWYAAGANGTLLVSYDNAVTWYSVNEAMQGYVLNNTLQANATSRGNRDGRNRFALSFNTNSVKVAANGNMVLTDTSASIGNITAVTLGENYNGTIRNIRFFPTAKTDSEVVQISLGSITPGINDTLQINAAGDTLQINAAGDTLRIN